MRGVRAHVALHVLVGDDRGLVPDDQVRQERPGAQPALARRPAGARREYLGAVHDAAVSGADGPAQLRAQVQGEHDDVDGRRLDLVGHARSDQHIGLLVDLRACEAVRDADDAAVAAPGLALQCVAAKRSGQRIQGHVGGLAGDVGCSHASEASVGAPMAFWAMRNAVGETVSPLLARSTRRCAHAR
ncbi:hypothetical protein D3C71_1197160 [compost metagenome]